MLVVFNFGVVLSEQQQNVNINNSKEHLAIFDIKRGAQPSKSPPHSTKPLVFNDVARLKGQHSFHQDKLFMAI